MNVNIELLSTDFDGTLHAEHEIPPVPSALQDIIAGLQAQGMVWLINTGRDLSSLMEALGRAELSVWPDYLVTVEREIHYRVDSRYLGLEEWNLQCVRDHEELFARVRPDLPRLTDWIRKRFPATIYEDPFSPLCLIAGNNPDADAIQEYLEGYCQQTPGLSFVRNDVYARFSHSRYNKGAALGEIARRLNIRRERVVAAGDHLNDLPMLRCEYAGWLIAPSNAVDKVKSAVLSQRGYVSARPWGHGLVEGLKTIMKEGGGSENTT